jgi:hypothetical protein
MAVDYVKKTGHIVTINRTEGSIVVAYDDDEKSKQTWHVSDKLKVAVLPKLSLGEPVEISIDSGNTVRFIKPLDDSGDARRRKGKDQQTSESILWQVCLKLAGQVITSKPIESGESNLDIIKNIVGMANGLYEISKEKLSTGKLPEWLMEEIRE